MKAETLVYGLHPVRHFLEHTPEQALELWIHADRRDAVVASLAAAARSFGVAVHEVPRRTLDALAVEGRHQGVVLRCRARPMPGQSDLSALLGRCGGPPLVLALDGVQDPHNLGACLRVANAAAVDAVVIPRHRGVGMTPAVRKVAAGAAESTPLVTVGNLVKALEALRSAGLQVIGTAAEAPQSVFQMTFSGPTVMVLGAEDRGLRRLTTEACDTLMRIPMGGVVESLNVSTAAAVCLFEAVRQRFPR